MTSTEEWKNHEQRLIQQIADGVSSARKRAGMSQRELAEAASLSQGAIANVEAGPPRVKQAPSIATLIRLALVLGVPPVQLIYPELPDAEVEVWPGATVTNIAALQWFSGDRTAQDTHIPAPISSNREVWLARQYASQSDRVRDIARRVEELDADVTTGQGDDEQQRARAALLESAQKSLEVEQLQLFALKQQIRELGGTVNNGNDPDGQRAARDLRIWRPADRPVDE